MFRTYQYAILVNVGGQKHRGIKLSHNINNFYNKSPFNPEHILASWRQNMMVLTRAYIYNACYKYSTLELGD